MISKKMYDIIVLIDATKKDIILSYEEDTKKVYNNNDEEVISYFANQIYNAFACSKYIAKQAAKYYYNNVK